jgi:hypothetical protein
MWQYKIIRNENILAYLKERNPDIKDYADEKEE